MTKKNAKLLTKQKLVEDRMLYQEYTVGLLKENGFSRYTENVVVLLSTVV